MEKIEHRVPFKMAESQILDMKLKFQTKDGFILASQQQLHTSKFPLEKEHVVRSLS